LARKIDTRLAALECRRRRIRETAVVDARGKTGRQVDAEIRRKMDLFPGTPIIVLER